MTARVESLTNDPDGCAGTVTLGGQVYAFKPEMRDFLAWCERDGCPIEFVVVSGRVTYAMRVPGEVCS